MKVDMFDFEDFEVPFDMVDDLAHNINVLNDTYITDENFFFSRFPPSQFHLEMLQGLLSDSQRKQPLPQEEVNEIPSFFSYEIVTIGSGSVDYNLKSSLEELLKSGASETSTQIKSAPIPTIEIVTEANTSSSSLTTSSNSHPNINNSSESKDEEPVEKPVEKQKESPRKLVDKWGFVVEDPADIETVSKSKRKHQHQLEEKWIQILREWDDYNADRKKRVLVLFILNSYIEKKN